MSDPVSTVLVVGSGVPAAMAALAIARAFRPLGLAVSWVATNTAASDHGALAAPPDLRTLHRLLGIAEADLLRLTPATLRTGEQFAGWSAPNSAFLHAYGDVGSAFEGLPFIQYWIRARRAGLGVALEDFCLAAAATKQRRFPAGQHGYHLDEPSYAALLTRACEAAGVRQVADASPVPVLAAEGIEGVALASGERLSADLYVDIDGALIDALDPKGTLPAEPFCDRLIAASAPPLSPVPLYARAAAHPAGYALLLPLRDRTAIQLCYSSHHLTDEQAAASLPPLAGLQPTAQDAPQALSGSWRPRPWVANCIALGRAAGQNEPLDAAPLLALQLAIGQLVLLWPVTREQMPEAAIYNEEIAGQHARIADFTAQHFRLQRRTSEPFWQEARARPITPELKAKIDLFAARGKFAHGDHEAHVEDSWALCMAGHGLVPRSSDPQAERAEDAVLMAEFQRQLRAIAEAVRAMEPHASALARLAQPGR